MAPTAVGATPCSPVMAVHCLLVADCTCSTLPDSAPRVGTTSYSLVIQRAREAFSLPPRRLEWAPPHSSADWAGLVTANKNLKGSSVSPLLSSPWRHSPHINAPALWGSSPPTNLAQCLTNLQSNSCLRPGETTRIIRLGEMLPDLH